MGSILSWSRQGSACDKPQSVRTSVIMYPSRCVHGYILSLRTAHSKRLILRSDLRDIIQALALNHPHDCTLVYGALLQRWLQHLSEDPSEWLNV